VACSSKTLVDFKWTTRCYIPEDRTLHNHCCENLQNLKFVYWFLAMLSVSNIEPYNAIALGLTTLTTGS
jgi:hypothetical protein